MTVQRPDLSPSAVESLLLQIERAIGRDLFNALRSLRDLVSIPAVATLILQRSIREVIDSVPWPILQNALARAQSRLAQARELGWRGALHRLPPPILRLPDLRLDLGAYAQQQPTVLDAIRRQDLSRITAITEETREAIREMLTQGLAKGRPPVDLARDIREVIGLNRPQARALANFRAQLEKQERDPAQIKRMVARRSGRMLNQRARVIAGHESMRALNEGKRAQWDRLVGEGHLNPADWEREWVTAGEDGRVCPICLPLHGVRSPIGGIFHSSVGPLPGPPAHVSCVLGGTLVTASPRIAAVTEREYSGPVCTIVTAGGKRLTCTPNHPLLTPAGWRPAGSLRMGDHVLTGALSGGVGETIEAVYGRISAEGNSLTVLGAASQFHGDGQDGGTVWIASPSADCRAGELAVRSQEYAPHREPAGRHGRGSGSLGELEGRTTDTAPHLASRSPHGQLVGESVRVSAPTSVDRIPVAASDVSLGTCGSSRGRLPDARPSKRPLRFALAQHGPRNGGVSEPSLTQGSASSTDVLDQESYPNLSMISCLNVEELVDIERWQFSGHVYNLETVEGWYAAEGIITHNCRCIERLVLRGFRKGERPAPARDRILAALGR